MMILVADSGSTKCDWLLENPGNEPQLFQTIGFNPMFHSADFITTEIQKNQELCSAADGVSLVYYYGASVSSPDRKATVVDALKAVFINAVIMAYHDLTGAVHATAGDEAGVVCILGTGSNSCYFNGKDTEESIPALGYILGDEAGGAWFGREFLRQYLYGNLSDDICYFLEIEGHHKEEIFRKVYRSEGANVFLASFMPLIHRFRDNKVIAKLLADGFDEFIRYHVLPFEKCKVVPIHFVGSIAVNFKEELSNQCSKHGLMPGLFSDKPIYNLFQYHTKHAQL